MRHASKVTSYIPLALSIASKYWHDDYAELRSEALSGLVHAGQHWDGDRPFGAFARRVIVNCLNRHYNQAKRRRTLEVPILDKQSNDGGIVKSEFMMEFKRWLETRTDRERKIIALRARGFDQREIAARVRIGQSYVSSTLQYLHKEWQNFAAHGGPRSNVPLISLAQSVEDGDEDMMTEPRDTYLDAHDLRRGPGASRMSSYSISIRPDSLRSFSD